MNLFFIPEPIFEKAVRIGVTCILFIVGILVTKRIVNTFFTSLAKKSRLSSYVQRIDTLNNLIQDGISLILLILLLLMIMREAGFDITPLLTGVGLLGLALTFGSQTLIKDVISGFFIIIENQFNVGDSVKIGDFKGVVFKINLRITILKDSNENLIYIPNSEIKQIVVYKKTRILKPD